MANTSKRSGRGFASMDPERQREIASQGGRAAHASGNAHEFTSAEAQAAGARSHSARQLQQQSGQTRQAGDNRNQASKRMNQPGSHTGKNQHR